MIGHLLATPSLWVAERLHPSMHSPGRHYLAHGGAIRLNNDALCVRYQTVH